MEYHIRAMQEQDIPFVSQIENQIFSLPWSEKSFRDAAANPDNVYLVCECTGEIAGYCGMFEKIVWGEGYLFFILDYLIAAGVIIRSEYP